MLQEPKFKKENRKKFLNNFIDRIKRKPKKFEPEYFLKVHSLFYDFILLSVKRREQEGEFVNLNNIRK